MSNPFNYTYDENKDDEGFYVPLEYANTFINQIVDRYNPAFKEIVVYGTNEFPLFILSTIRGILDISQKSCEEIVKKFNSAELLKKCQVCIETVSKNGNPYIQKKKNVMMLTKFGIYHIMFSVHNPIALIFQDFVYFVMHELEINQIAVLKTALKTLEYRTRKVTDERDQLLMKQFEYTNDRRRLEGLIDITSSHDDFEAIGNTEYKLFLFLKKRHMERVPFYIVDPTYIKKMRHKKKSKDEYDTDLDLEEKELRQDFQLEPEPEPELEPDDILEYNAAELGLAEIESAFGEEFYFYIPGFRCKAQLNKKYMYLLGELEIYDKAQHTALHERLNQIAKTSRKGVYRLTYEALQGAISHYISNKLFMELDSR